MPAMRLSGRRGTAAAQQQMQIPSTIICPVCGLRNDVTVRFCRNCGLPLGAPRDPVRGTTTKRAELPSDRGSGIAAILGLLVVVGLVGGAGFLILRGAQAGPAGPGASQVALASRAPSRSLAAASIEPAVSSEPGEAQPVASDPPAATDEPQATDEPSQTDEPGPAKTPASSATRSAWTCKTGSIVDPLRGRWRIIRANWKSGTSSDRITLSLSRTSGTAPKPGTTVALAFMSPGKAASTLGVTRPLGDRAIVLTFDGPVTPATTMVGQPDMRVVESVDIRRDDSVSRTRSSACPVMVAPDSMRPSGATVRTTSPRPCLCLMSGADPVVRPRPRNGR